MNVVVKKLVWDGWNVAHIAHHKVLPEEVEEVCGSYIAYKSYDGRLKVIGTTKQERILLIVLNPESKDCEYYVVTAHTASKKDQALYLGKGGKSHDTK